MAKKELKEAGSRVVIVRKLTSNYEREQDRANRGLKENARPKSPQFEKATWKTQAPYIMNGGGAINYGMTHSDLKTVFSQIFMCKEEEVNMKEVKEWFYKCIISVPAPGNDPKNPVTLKLETGKDKDGYYLNPLNYIHYKILCSCNNVCTNPAERHSKHEVIVEDPQLQEDNEAQLQEIKDQAAITLIDMKTSYDTIKMYLFILKGYGVPELEKTDLTKLKNTQMYITLNKVVDNHPELFLKVNQDKDAQIRFTIEQLITIGELERKNYYISYPSNNEPIGTMEEAIFWFKNPSNKNTILGLESKLRIVSGKN